MRDYAKSKRGQCLSENYLNSKTHLTWQCEKGHIWDATTANILKGRWCPKCSGRKKLSLDLFKNISKERGGRLLSNEYKNIDTNMLWECSKGHRWEATGNNIKLKNTWCPICSGSQRLSIDIMQEVARQRKGEFLSDHYINLKSKYRWRCEYGHEWETTGFNVKTNNNWCPKCSGITEYTISDLSNHAIQLGGSIISLDYINVDTKYKWKCKFDHKWEATWWKIKDGQWCPKCSNNSIKEEKLRICFETLFGVTFPKSYPSFLINSSGNKMEYDGYSKKLNLAFEFQGRQHFMINYFTKTQEALDKRINDDKEKIDLSIVNGVTLFIVTYKDPVEKFKSKVLELASVHKLNHLIVNNVNPNYSLAYLAHDRYNEMKLIVKSKGGELLSNQWEGALERYTIRCKKHDYTWSKTGSEILNNDRWCSKCGIEKRKMHKFEKTYLELQNFAKKHNAKLISTEYIGQNESYEFCCKRGHSVKFKWIYRLDKKYFCRVCEEGKIKQEEFIKKANKIHNFKYDYSLSEYSKSITPIVIICPIHGPFHKTPTKHISSKQGCQKCPKKQNKIKNKLLPTKPKLD